MDESAPKEEAVIPISVVTVTGLWFVFATIGFTWLIITQFDDPALRSSTAVSLSWPFVVLVVALPAVLLVGANVRHLLSLKKAIDDAPVKLSEALETAEKLQENIEETGGSISNNLNAVMSEIEARYTAFEGRLQRIAAQVPGDAPQDQEATPRERLAAHLETASARFYLVLEQWNNDARRKGNQLVVTRGGGNRRELVDQLREASAFDRDIARNVAIANYLKAVFERQLSARRGGVEEADVENLDALRLTAERHGAGFEQ